MSEDRAIQKSSGLTKSERYLAALCERTFLSLWSYPNTHYAPGKELCDVLAICGDDIILFSDKHRPLTTVGPPEVAWGRWYRKAVLGAVRQLKGAKRRLLSAPKAVFLDADCVTPLPIEMPAPDRARFHLVVVARGAKQACQRHFDGRGSLMLMPGRLSLDESGGGSPFAVGMMVGPDVVHVLDDANLGIVLKELDTIADLASYLQAKEKLVREGRLFSAASEEDLLARYLTNLDENQQRCFPEGSDLDEVVREGSWDGLASHPQYAAKKDRDKLSYLWDEIIIDVAGHAMRATLVPESSGGLTEAERALRFMARETRFARRLYGGEISDKLQNAPQKQNSYRRIQSMGRDDLLYVFMVSPFWGDDYEAYRVQRRESLGLFCLAALCKQREFKIAVGIGTEGLCSPGGCSHDLLVREAPEEWPPELEAAVEAYCDDLGLMKEGRTTYRHVHEDEYPFV